MSRARNTTTAPTGSIAPLGLRLLPELRSQIETAARTNGRSLNAEVSARLQASFEAPSTERVNELELELSRQRSLTAIERNNAFQYSIALMSIADRLPAEAFDATPSIAAILKDAKENKNAKIIAALKQMVEDTSRSMADIDSHVAAGRIKVVPKN